MITFLLALMLQVQAPLWMNYGSAWCFSDQMYIEQEQILRGKGLEAWADWMYVFGPDVGCYLATGEEMVMAWDVVGEWRNVLITRVCGPAWNGCAFTARRNLAVRK
jgi:hypothetical protein